MAATAACAAANRSIRVWAWSLMAASFEPGERPAKKGGHAYASRKVHESVSPSHLHKSGRRIDSCAKSRIRSHEFSLQGRLLPCSASMHCAQSIPAVRLHSCENCIAVRIDSSQSSLCAGRERVELCLGRDHSASDFD